MTIPKDSILGIIAMALAAAYLAAAGDIQKSMLADAVGADGVPRALAFAMGGVGVLLAVLGFARARVAASETPDDGEGDEAISVATHVKALGLLALLVGYVVALPWLGYLAAMTLLIAGIAAYAGARPSLTLVTTAAVGALALLTMFQLVLKVAMPAGVFGWP